MTISTVDRVFKNFFSKALPVVAGVALIIPASRKVFGADWRDELGASYQLGERDVGSAFFLLVGLLEFVLAAAILWPRTRVPAGLAMGGFFVGALFFNLVLRVDQDVLPDDRSTLGQLIPLDLIHLALGVAVAWLWRTSGKPEHLFVAER
ncbi:MAG: hypothetical protein AB8G14_11900 [Ilumatobacter sp.]